nr:MAG TPA: hypothetical protein [Caudoviricetes sp.]
MPFGEYNFSILVHLGSCAALLTCERLSFLLFL